MMKAIPTRIRVACSITIRVSTFAACLFASQFMFCGSGQLLADEITLKGGGTLTGDVKAIPTDDKPFYDIITEDGFAVRLARANVTRVKKPSETLLKYENEMLPLIKDTIEDHLKMIEWCRANKLSDQIEYHKLRILRLDPDHKETRQSLGYQRRRDGRWLLVDQLRAEQGYVADQSGWITPEWKSFEDAKKAYTIKESDWRKKIRVLRKSMTKDERRSEAIASIRQISDPIAASPLSQWLNEESDVGTQEMLIETLGKMDSSVSRKMLIVTSIKNDNAKIREQCLTILQKKSRTGFVNDYINSLNPRLVPENHYINRAAIALGWMDAEQAVRPLIDALVTEHKKLNPGGGGGNMSATRSNGGFNFGGEKPKFVKGERRNPDVLQTLRNLTGENFEYNKEAWVRWYARSKTPTSFDLRRNP